MGWYDNSFFNAFSKFYLILVLLIFLSYNSAISQENAEAGEGPREYEIDFTFPTNVYHNYIYSQHTEVIRKFDSGDEIKFNRDLTFWITMKAPDKKENGFLTVEVQIDSLEYRLSSDVDTVYFHSFNDEGRFPPFNVKDYEYHSIPLGMEFEITYSNYNDVAEISGNMLDEKLRMITDSLDGIKDENRLKMWLDGLSLDNLSFYADPIKNMIPDTPLALDSSFTTSVHSNIDGINFVDTVEVELSNISPRNFILKASSLNSFFKRDKYPSYKFDTLVELIDLKNESEYTVRISPRGNLNLLEIVSSSILTKSIGKDTFKEEINSKHSWQLMRMWTM